VQRPLVLGQVLEPGGRRPSAGSRIDAHTPSFWGSLVQGDTRPSIGRSKEPWRGLV
jgi:hypothetical protein